LKQYDRLMMQRYFFIELAKSATVVGLVLAATGARHVREVADRLEELLRRAGRRTYRFMVGQCTPEKLGNFPEVELFVSLASPEHFPWDSKDFITPIASPYEIEVALGAREWTGEYITDLEELLNHPVFTGDIPGDAELPDCNAGKIAAADAAAAAVKWMPAPPLGVFAPAKVTEGLDGVAACYKGEKES
jgi:hypothetical protein